MISTPTKATARPPSSGNGPGRQSSTPTRRACFPLAKEPEDYPLPLPEGTTGGEYLDLIREVLPVLSTTSAPIWSIYNAGSDPFVDDPLAGLRLTMSELAERDLLVVSLDS